MSNFLELPPATGQGSQINGSGQLTPVWSERPILLPSLTNQVLCLNEVADEVSKMTELDIPSDEVVDD